MIQSRYLATFAAPLAAILGPLWFCACGAHEEDASPEGEGSLEQALIAGANITSVSASFNLPGAGDVETSVECPTNSVVVSGGYVTTRGTRVIQSRKSNRNGWALEAINDTTTATTGRVTAQCLTGTSASLRADQFVNGTIPRGAKGCVQASCSGGLFTATSGGFITQPFIRVLSSRPVGTTSTWEICAQNENTFQNGNFSVAAHCLSGVSGGAKGGNIFSNVNVPARSTSRLTNNGCLANTLLSSGSITTSSSSALVTLETQRVSASDWSILVFNSSNTPAAFSTQNYCLDLFRN
jgi:hypothetical protein